MPLIVQLLPSHRSRKQGNDNRDEGLSRGGQHRRRRSCARRDHVVLDTTNVNVALDALSRDLHSPLSTIQWVSTGYLLSLAMVIPLVGLLSERFGATRVWMVSVAVFAVGSSSTGLPEPDIAAGS